MEARRQGFRIAGTALGLGLLGIAALQLHAVEARLVTQSQQIRALGEATERMAAQLERVRGGVAGQAQPAAPSIEGVLHPELEDFLKPKETHWPAPGANTNGKVAIDWFTGDPKGFNPLIESFSDLPDKLLSYVEGELAKPNFWSDPDKYYGDLAWRAEVRDDFKEFTFYLRKGVKWHPVSGVDLTNPRYAWLNREHLLTAHDFVFTLDMLMDPQVQNGFIKSYYAELGSWKALDDHTLQLKWNKTQALNVDFSMRLSPFPKFLFAHAEDGSPIPAASVGLALNQHWYNNRGVVGTGPYRFVEYTPGVQIRLERNEDYYGEQPALQGIKYVIYTDRTQTVLKLKSGELDFGQLRAGQYREEVLAYEGLPAAQRPTNSPFLNGDITCDLVDQPVYYHVGWNGDKPMFSDRRVRRAMTLAFNRHEVVSKVFSGLGHVARGPYLDSTPYHAPEIQPLPFDLEAAAALLAEAGWADSDGDGLLDKVLGGTARTPFEFTLSITSTTPEWLSAAKIFKEDLLSIGIKMNIDAAEWSLMLKRMEEKQFDAYISGWGLTWITEPYQTWHSSQADVPKGSNRIGFRNPKADKLIEELRVTLDPDKRTAMLRDLHRILHEEQPYTFVMIPKFPYCRRKSLQGVVYAKIRPIANTLPWWSTDTDG
jgi:peptide/nickel transport system substrate-binding protein